jgi:hypothetical protein
MAGDILGVTTGPRGRAMPGLPICGPMNLGCAEAPTGTATITRPGSKAWMHERRKRLFMTLLSGVGQGRRGRPEGVYANRVPGNRSTGVGNSVSASASRSLTSVPDSSGLYRSNGPAGYWTGPPSALGRSAAGHLTQAPGASHSILVPGTRVIQKMSAPGRQPLPGCPASTRTRRQCARCAQAGRGAEVPRRRPPPCRSKGHAGVGQIQLLLSRRGKEGSRNANKASGNWAGALECGQDREKMARKLSKWLRSYHGRFALVVFTSRAGPGEVRASLSEFRKSSALLILRGPVPAERLPTPATTPILLASSMSREAQTVSAQLPPAGRSQRCSSPLSARLLLSFLT